MIRFFKKAASAVLAMALCAAFVSCQKSPQEGETALPGGGVRVAAPDVLRAITVGAGNRADYPGPGVSGTEALAKRAGQIVSFAVDSSMNAILYKANPYGEAMWPSRVLPQSHDYAISGAMGSRNDPLAVLIDRARGQGVAVYALISPYEAGHAADKPEKGSILQENPSAAITVGDTRYYRPDNPLVHAQAVHAAAELTAHYDLAGVVVGDADDAQVNDYQGFYTYLSVLVADMSGVVKAAGEGVQMGLALSTDSPQSGNRDVFLSEACRASVDWIAPTIQQPAPDSLGGTEASPYAMALRPLIDIAAQQGKGIFTALPESFSAGQSGAALLANNILGLSGGIAGDYGTLSGDEEKLVTAIPMMHLKGRLLPETAFGFPQEFRLTRPLDGERLSVDAAWEQYYITGTSDPSKPVYFGDEEIQRIGEHGLFGAMVDVEPGENEYTFMQNGVVLTASIYRPEPDEARVTSTISTYINKGNPGATTFQPYGPQAVSPSLPMLFQCTAPSGGVVTATLNGETYPLEQTSSAKDGTPVTFRKEARIDAPDPNAVASAGFVTYTLDYEGTLSEAQAPGEVFLVGANRKALLRVAEGMGTVLNPTMEGGDFMTTLKTGSVAEIAGQTANYFKTSYGGFILKKSVSIITDQESAANNISSVEYLPANDKGDESLVLRGTTCPSFIVDESGAGDFVIRLQDTYGVSDGPLPAQGNFFQSGTASNGDSGELTLSFKGGGNPYFGYNVTYDGNDTVISFKAKPKLSGLVGQPLSGMTIVLDPGHGAIDIGAMGVPGITGPVEKNVNLYAAQVMRRLLEGMGATVEITRETDEDFLELEERVAFAERFDADLFISVHHNSLQETTPPENNMGTEVYYYNDISADIAEVYLDHITAATGRKKRSAAEGYYVVCRNTLAPSVLLELGFMANAAEYEQICNAENMLVIARSVGSAIKDYVGSLAG